MIDLSEFEFFLLSHVPLLDRPEIADHTGIDLAGFPTGWTVLHLAVQITVRRTDAEGG
jgi:hypothetical protein